MGWKFQTCLAGEVVGWKDYSLADEVCSEVVGWKADEVCSEVGWNDESKFSER